MHIAIDLGLPFKTNPFQLFDEDFRGRVTKLVEAGFADAQGSSANSNM